MNILLNIEAGTPGELQEAITGLASIMGGAVTPQPEKQKRTSRETSKPEKQPDPVVESDATEDTAGDTNPDQDAPDTETKEIPTVVELRAAAQTKGGTPEGKKSIKALLEKFKSSSISSVPEDKRAAFLAALNAL